MKKLFYSLTTIVICMGWINFLHAECTGDCVQYCGDGYCTDYIQYRLGVKQSGNANEWYGNICIGDVQVNDVAIFDDPNPTGHVAVVDKIDGNDITISEWNWGSKSSDPAKLSCGVTTMYHTKNVRTISKNSVSRFWRSTLSRKYIPECLAYFRVGNLAWYPSNSSCMRAERWVYFRGGYPNGGMSTGDCNICKEKETEMVNALGGYLSDNNWWEIIYGWYDIDEYKTCE